MKHIFIVNVIAGKKDYYKIVISKIDEFINKNLDLDIIVHKTVCKNDATSFVKSICEEFTEDSKRFYACGGDGTINEVLNGLMGYENVSLGVYPCGSGNDFTSNFPEYNSDIMIEELVNGQTMPIDVIKVNHKYAINVVNVGMDANVAHDMQIYKNYPLINGKMAYLISLLFNFFKSLSVKLKIIIDNDIFIEDEFLFCVAANGRRYGGSFIVAPTARVNNGTIFMCAIKKIPTTIMMKLISIYKKGEHINPNKYMKHFTLKQCKNIRIITEEPVPVCYDGEEFISNDINIDIISSVLNLILPCKNTDSTLLKKELLYK